MDKLLYAAVGGLVTYAIIRIYDDHKRKNNRVVPAPSTIRLMTRLAIKAGAALECTVNDACISAAQNALDSDLDPFDDIGCSAATKLHLAKVLLDRVVRRLVAVQ